MKKHFKNNKGFASILLIGIVGISISGLVLSTSYSIKANQNQANTTNKLTQAQLKVWTTQEAINKYFQILDENELSKIKKGNLEIDNLIISEVNATIKEIIPNDTIVCDGSTRIGVDILAKVSSANSSTYSIFCVGSAGAATNNTTTVVKKLDYALHLKGYTTFNEQVKILGVNNKNIQVDGDVNLEGANLTGANLFTTGSYTQTTSGRIKSIFAEKNIDISGANDSGNFSYLKSLGNITLTGSNTGADFIQANGSVKIRGNSYYPIIKANGSVTLDTGSTIGNVYSNSSVSIPSATVENVFAKGNVNKTAGQDIGNITTNGSVTISNGGHNSVGDITAGGNVSLSAFYLNPTNIKAGGNVTFSKNQDVNSVYAKGNLTISQSSYVGTGIVGGNLNKGPTPSDVNVVKKLGYDPKIPPVDTQITLLEPIKFADIRINAEDYLSQANYIFEYLDGYIRVTPQNLTDTKLEMGKKYYMLTDYDNNGKLYHNLLCPTATYNKSKCFIFTKQPTSSQWNREMITYSDGTFFIEENARRSPMFGGGILFFRGSVNITNATVHNTIITTHDIYADTNTIETKASNNNSYSYTCSNTYPKPINLCSNGQMLSPVVGNAAFIAGSYSPNDPTQFVGGNVSIVGSNTKIGGNVLAGNTINSYGGAYINGYVVTARQSKDLSSGNLLGSGVVVDLVSTTASFKPEEIFTEVVSNSTTETQIYVPGAKIKYSKYK